MDPYSRKTEDTYNFGILKICPVLSKLWEFESASRLNYACKNAWRQASKPYFGGRNPDISWRHRSTIGSYNTSFCSFFEDEGNDIIFIVMRYDGLELLSFFSEICVLW